MSSLLSSRYALSVCLSAAVLAGCSGLQSPVGVSPALPQTSVNAPSFHVLYRFAGVRRGAVPNASLLDLNGTLYGTAGRGGRLRCPFGCGAVYSMSTTGVEKVLYRFKGPLDGEAPAASLIDVNGRLYGTTFGGGATPCPGLGCGTVYSVSTTGHEKVLHSFGESSDGSEPSAALIEVKGTLYGTTEAGGAPSCNCGTVYSISTTGAEKVLYRFAGGSDGSSPQAALVNVNGTLYGTTANGGGSGCSGLGCGTVYSITTAGVEKVVYRFAGGASDGASPQAGLVKVKGALYGTTFYGGGSGCYDNGCGTVYSISTTGVEKVLYHFAGGSDGANPQADLIGVQATLYGTTTGGGGSRCSGGCGTVYSMDTTGSEKVLHSFKGGSDGASPQAGLLNVNGVLYGTTAAGGSHCYEKLFSCGIVFALSR
jgi:uncharacterized repeat protein (TIGR03803 family)